MHIRQVKGGSKLQNSLSLWLRVVGFDWH